LNIKKLRVAAIAKELRTMTYANAIDYVIKNYDLPAEVAEKMQALTDSLAKRYAAKSGKPTKVQRENAPIKDAIVKYLKDCGEPQTCAQIRSAVSVLADATPQKVSALLRQLDKDDGLIKRFVEKRTTYFQAK
jgi:hypothetical protein